MSFFDNDYDTENEAILAKIYKLLNENETEVYKKAGEGEYNSIGNLVLFKTPLGPIFISEFDYGTSYGTSSDLFDKMLEEIKKIPLSKEELRKTLGGKDDPKEIEEFEEYLDDNPEISELITP